MSLSERVPTNGTLLLHRGLILLEPNASLSSVFIPRDTFSHSHLTNENPSAPAG